MVNYSTVLKYRKDFFITMSQNKKYTLTGSLFLILFLIWTFLVKFNTSFIQNFDLTFQKILKTITNPTMTYIVKGITFIGSPQMTIILCLILCVYIYFKFGHQNTLWALIILVGGNLLNFIVKHIIQRARPIDKLVPQSGYSYPSGHTLGTALVVFLLVVFLTYNIKNQALKLFFSCLGAVWVVIMAATRIYLHVHYPSDTFASMLLAMVIISFSLNLKHKYLQD